MTSMPHKGCGITNCPPSLAHFPKSCPSLLDAPGGLRHRPALLLADLAVGVAKTDEKEGGSLVGLEGDDQPPDL